MSKVVIFETFFVLRKTFIFYIQLKCLVQIKKLLIILLNYLALVCITVNADLVIYPANENFGIKFCRVDIDKKDFIDANFKNVVEPILCTKISK